MKKWGIPKTQHTSNEQTLLERLVWVKNEGHWWPALLYQSYAELQTLLYDRLDMAMKAQFAVAIMKELQAHPQRKPRVARLLGRDMLEVVEVKDGQYAEFYWQLPNVLPHACQRSEYGSNTELFIDFHRALDQVEEIIQEISENKVHLLPSNDQKTWEQRAREALQADRSTSAPNLNEKSVSEAKPTVKRSAEGNDDGMFGGLDSFMATLSKGVDDLMGTEAPKDRRAPKVVATPLVIPDRRATSESFGSTDRYTAVIPPPRHDEINNSFSSGQFASTTRAVFDEARDPSNEYYRRRAGYKSQTQPRGDGSNGGTSKGSSSTSQRAKSIELLPGLEAEDIIPGITETNVWKNVLEHMLVSKSGNQDQLEEVSVALERSAKKQMYQQHRRMQGRTPSQPDMQYHEEATFAAKEVEPKFKKMSFVSTESENRAAGPRLRSSAEQPMYQYRSTSMSPFPADPLSEYHPDGHSDPDTILAEEPRNRNMGLDPNSDDTLWGFLTCRATDI
jgi:hypothetical protein